MFTSFSCLGRSREFRPSCFQSVFAIALATAFVAGCGGGSGSGSSPVSSGNTSVVVLASSTANDEMNAFQLTIESLTLTSKSGEQVTLLASPVGEEYIHLNGHVEPLATVSIPQGVYVSAAATFGSSVPECAGQVSGGISSDLMTGGPSTTVNLPNPITVTGTAMGLILNLQVAPYPGACPTPALYASAPPVTSSFNLTPITFAAQPTNSTNGIALGLEGSISSVDANGGGFVVSALINSAEVSNPLSWHAILNGNSVFQGIAGASQLKPGLPVDMDLAIQPDGSLLATRIDVISTDTTTLTVANGPLAEVSSAEPVTFLIGAAQQGYLPLAVNGFGYVSFGNAEFQTSGQFSNLASLPFTASFNGANMVSGQNVTITTQATAYASEPVYTPATTMTLRPQTIDGTVSAISSQGNFTAYSVTLAPYDLFPQFAVQPGQTTLLTNPSTVVVYADNNTQMLNSSSVGVGGVFRFYGLVFNDNGTLRMDCAQINDGVAE